MFQRRIKDLRQKLEKDKVDAVLISDVANIVYLTGFTNFSKDERESYVFVGQDFAYIITDGRYTEAVKREVSHLTLFERGHKKTTADLFKKHKKEIKSLGIEEDNLTVAEYKVFSKHFKNTKHFEVSHLRSIKTPKEINKIEKACRLGDLAFKHILKKFKVGVTEKEIAQEMENFIKCRGAGISFPTIVAFGKNSSVPHHQTGETKLTGNDFVLLDFGVKLNNYCSDMTRTIFVGQPTVKQKEIYDVVLAAQQKAVDFINSAIKAKKEITAAEVDKIARDYIIAKGYSSIPHSLGHGVGLEVHEGPHLSPKSKDILKAGMVFSIEPGIYLSDFGGVRIEDLFVLQDDKLKQLTDATKKIISL
ncbi:MAG: Xaa-Pro peptidase family protein [Patescibacteria group bacterium]|nr:Xaa-Pro peptidase family protein [Patescibacteria group bacterium]